MPSLNNLSGNFGFQMSNVKCPCEGCKDRFIKEVEINGVKRLNRCHDGCEKYKRYCERKGEISQKMKDDKRNWVMYRENKR